MRIKSERVKKLGILYLILATLIAFLLGHFNWLTYYRLSKYGVKTNAYVTKTTCENHQTFHYRFIVGEENFEGTGLEGSGNPSCDSLKIGAPVVIYYIPSNPQINVPGRPKARLANESIFILLAALIIPLVIVNKISKFYSCIQERK